MRDERFCQGTPPPRGNNTVCCDVRSIWIYIYQLHVLKIQAFFKTGLWQCSDKLKKTKCYDYLQIKKYVRVSLLSRLKACVELFILQLVAEKTRELIKKDSTLKDVVMNSILIDHYLWDFRREHAEEMRDNIPFHRIRCIYY